MQVKVVFIFLFIYLFVFLGARFSVLPQAQEILFATRKK
jgi:hypothetical protein